MYKRYLLLIFLLQLSFWAKAQKTIPLLPNCTITAEINLKPDSLSQYNLEELCCYFQSNQAALDSYKKALPFLSELQNRILLSNKNYNYESQVLACNLEANLWLKLDSIENYLGSLMQSARGTFRLGNLYTSYKYSTTVFDLANENGFILLKADAIDQLAWIKWSTARFDEAIDDLSIIKTLLDNHDLPNLYKTRYLNALANFLKANNEYSKAREVGDSLIFYSIKYEDHHMLGKAYSNMVHYLDAEKDKDLRKDLANKALDINHRMNDKEQLGSNYGLLAYLNLAEEEYKLAISNYNKSLSFAEEIGDRVRIQIAYRGMAICYDSLGLYEQAYLYKRKQFEIHEEIYTGPNVSKIFNLEQSIAQREIEKLQNKQEITALKLKQKNANLALAFTSIFFLLFSSLFYFYFNKRRHQLKQLRLEAEYNNQIKEIEMDSLRAQMNPHFIFNSLNSIKSYITTNESRIAAHYLTKFSKLIRLILNHSKLNRIGLEEEIEALKLYIELEQLRLSNSFEYAIEIENDLDLFDVDIPPMIIQPYVENAIWHGLIHKKGLKSLDIHISRDDDFIQINIKDSGIGRKASEKINKSKIEKHKSFGTAITQKRIELMTGIKNENSVKINDLYDHEGVAIGTKVTIKLRSKN